MAQRGVMTFRADERLRFGLRLIAEANGLRNTSDAITFAVEHVLRDASVGLYDPNKDDAVSLQRVLQTTWDEDEVTRFVRLRQFYPRLLSADEKKMERLVEALEVQDKRKFGRDDLAPRWQSLKLAAAAQVPES